jgi:two-component system sensor histidine kinase BaeS
VRTLRGRLFALTAVTVLLAVVATGGLAAILVRHRLVDQRTAVLARQAEAVSALVASGDHVFTPGRGGGLKQLHGPLAARVLAAVPAGTTAGELHLRRRDLLYASRAGDRAHVVVIRPAVRTPTGSAPYLRAILIAAIGGALVAGLVALAMAGRLVAPLRALGAATRRVAAGERTEVTAAAGAPEEVRALAEAFTQMASELADSRDAQRAFLLSVSHELKTPLTAIRGYAEGLEDGAVEPHDAGRIIAAEAARLERLVSDLLDLARADRRGFDVRRERVDLRAIAAQTVERHAPFAERVGVEVELAPGPPAFAQADPDRVGQALSNLVENALRVTPRGGTVTVRAADGLLTVADTGPGLDADDLPHAFERFYLHDRLRSDRPVGSGLGLAIVDEIARAMGGRASVRSERGAGAEFALHLPHAEAQAALEAGV